MITIRAWIHRVRVGGIGRNGLFSLLQTCVNIICMFLSYRLLITQDGIASLGLWSLLMVFGGMAMTFDVSGASALTRSVSRHALEFADTTRAVVVHTVLLTSMAMNAVMVVLLLGLAPFVLPGLIAPDQQPLAWTLIPWVAAAMLVTPFAVGMMSSIDGVMRADQRAVLVAASAVASLVFAWFAIPRFGVVGLAMAQCAQQAMVIVGGWLILRRHISDLGWAPVRWQRSVFRRTTGYAIKLNAVGVLSLLFEPLAKFCINLGGGTAAVGIYELAARLAQQLRSLVVSSTTPLIPAFAMANGAGDPHFAGLLHSAQRYVNIAALAVAVLTVIAAPLMCFIILGHVSAEVLRFNALLALGWSANIFALPLYLAAQAQGVLRWNVASHAAIGVAIVLATLLLMPVLGSTGVVVGVAAGLMLGAAVTIVGNARIFGAGPAVMRELPAMALVLTVILLVWRVMWVGADTVADMMPHHLQL